MRGISIVKAVTLATTLLTTLATSTLGPMPSSCPCAGCRIASTLRVSSAWVAASPSWPKPALQRALVVGLNNLDCDLCGFAVTGGLDDEGRLHALAETGHGTGGSSLGGRWCNQGLGTCVGNIAVGADDDRLPDGNDGIRIARGLHDLLEAVMGDNGERIDGLDAGTRAVGQAKATSERLLGQDIDADARSGTMV